MIVKELQANTFKKYMCKVSIDQCSRAKTKEIIQKEGSLIEDYARIRDYVVELYTKKSRKYC